MPLDIGVGILLSMLVSAACGVPCEPHLIAFGIASALFPDIDLVTALFGTWRHRGLTHYPLLYIPLFVLAFLMLPLPYALLFMFGVCAHLVHDTFGIGWGIAWLWPFSTRRFLIFPERARRKILGTFVSWRGEDDAKVRALHYEGASENWVRDFYFRPNSLAYIEYGVLVVSLLTLAAYIW